MSTFALHSLELEENRLMKIKGLSGSFASNQKQAVSASALPVQGAAELVRVKSLHVNEQVIAPYLIDN
jgi:hypothetical protein